MTASLLDRIDRAARALGDPLDPAASERLLAWLTLLVEWNARVDLTAARSDDELVDLMIADALVLAPHIPERARVVDVGSGAGAPGLPIAIVRPDLEVTLIEPKDKRVAFLRLVAAQLPGGGPRVLRGRGEEIAKKGERFDVAISRATLAPPAWAALGHALAPHGDVWVLVAKEEPSAPKGLIFKDDRRYVWPLTGAERRAVRLAPA